MGIKKVKKDMVIKTKSAILAGLLYDVFEKLDVESFRYSGKCCYEGDSEAIESICFMVPRQKLSGVVRSLLFVNKDFKKEKDYKIFEVE